MGVISLVFSPKTSQLQTNETKEMRKVNKSKIRSGKLIHFMITSKSDYYVYLLLRADFAKSENPKVKALRKRKDCRTKNITQHKNKDLVICLESRTHKSNMHFDFTWHSWLNEPIEIRIWGLLEWHMWKSQKMNITSKWSKQARGLC